MFTKLNYKKRRNTNKNNNKEKTKQSLKQKRGKNNKSTKYLLHVLQRINKNLTRLILQKNITSIFIYADLLIYNNIYVLLYIYIYKK